MSAFRTSHRRSLFVVAVAAAIVGACSGASSSSTPSPAGTGGPPGSVAPTAPGSGTSVPASATGSWARLEWESVDPPDIPPHRWMTSVLSSERGLLIRVVERPDSTVIPVYTTTDGRTWTRSSTDPENAPFGSPVDGAADWLQVGEPTGANEPLDLLASEDGRTWTVRGHLPDEMGNVVMSAVRGDTIVACGQPHDTERGTLSCAVSVDAGASWRNLPELREMLATKDVLGVGATPAGFLVAARTTVDGVSTGGGALSSDGIDWTILPDAPGLEALSPEIGAWFQSFRDSHVITGAVLDGREFVHGVWTSGDGRSWQRVPLPRTVAWSTELEILDGSIVALADDGRGEDTRYVSVVVSTDGRNWRSDAVPDELTGSLAKDWWTLRVGDVLLVIARDMSRAIVGRPVAASDSGPAPAPSATPVPVPSGAAPPTVTWVTAEAGLDGTPTDLVAWGDGFLAVGYITGPDGHWAAATWTSVDGLAWTRTLEPADFPHTRMNGVTTDGSVLVAAGYEYLPLAAPDVSPVAAFWRSKDGVAWERADTRRDFVIGLEKDDEGWRTGLGDVTAGGPGFVAVGATRDDGATVWTSTDGLDWRRSAALGDAAIGGVTAGGPGLVAVGSTGGPQSDGRIWTSADGLAWAGVDTLPEGEVGGVTSARDVLFGFGWGPTLWRSTDGLAWESVPDQPSLRRTLNDEGIGAVVGMPWGFVAVGSMTCPASTRQCPAAWTSADGLRWERTLMPEAASPAPIAVAVSGDRILAIAPTGDGSEAQSSWSSWVGRLAP